MARRTVFSSAPLLSPRGRRLLIVAAVVVALAVGLFVGVGLYADWLWFSEVGFTGVFSKMAWTRTGLFVVVGGLAAAVIAANMIVAFRLRPPYRSMAAGQQDLERYRLALTPRFGLATAAVAIVVGIITGISAQGSWSEWLLFTNSTSFGVTDPQFGKDISFYVFELPFWRFLLNTAFVIVALCLISAFVIHYLYGGLRLAGAGSRMSTQVIVHLSVLFGILVSLKAIAYYFDRYGLLTSRSNITDLNGAMAVETEWLIPAKNILMWIAAVCAIMFFINVGVKRILLPTMALILLGVSAVVVGGVVPALANQFSIKPSAKTREAPYIERNIQASRQAYALDFSLTPYRASTTPISSDPSADIATVSGARVLDPSVVSPTFRQLQQVRSFYDFNPQLDVARYEVGGKLRDYVVGVRELDSTQLTGGQGNWINRHTVYTHGYGFVAAPANQVDGAGAPVFVSGALGDAFTSAEAEAFEQAVPVKQPRVYYGELMHDYSITGKAPGEKDQELDRPAAVGGEDGEQINTTYTGKGGVELDNIGRRLLYSLYFREKNFLLSSAVSEYSKVLYVRDPRARVEKVAPFLKADGDPYPAVVDGRVVWILDAYTTTNDYPYSQRTSIGDATVDSRTGQGTDAQVNETINYIRNSVKATVDAYDGTVTLYEWDTSDPVLKTWNKAFDGIIKPRSSIPAELSQNFRYPEDLFKVQRKMYAQYHVDDPNDFFSGQDFWKVPDDPTRTGTDPQPPYYMVMQLPEAERSRFVLSTPMTAAKRENLAALMTAYYDDSGKAVLGALELPGNSAVPGPNQAQPKMRNDANVRQNLTLLTSGDSTVVYGNLLTLPVAGGLLYIEPIYVQGVGQNAYPLMERVLVLFGDKVAYEKNLTDAITALLSDAQPGTSPPPAEGEEGTPPPSETPSPGANPELDAAVNDIRAALEHLKKAQQDGDFEGIGKAQAELDAAIKRFEAAGG